MHKPSQKRKNARLAAVALCAALCLLLTSCSIPGLPDFKFPWDNSSKYDHTEDGRRTIPYSDMKYERPDVDSIKTRMGELTEGIKNAASFEELKKLDDEAGDLYENYYTMNSLAHLKKCHDVTDTYYEEEYRYLEDQGVELSNLMNDLNQEIVDGPFADDYRKDVGDYVYQSMVNALRLNSKEVEDYKKERAQLSTDYDKDISTYTTNFRGKDYTLTEISELEVPGIDDMEMAYLRYALRDQFFKEHADHFTQMYARMVELDKQTAATLGFESAAEMYYLGYDRDYTPAEALALCESAQEIFAPLTSQVLGYAADSGSTELKKTFNAMPEMVANVSEELAQAWDHMVTFELSDYEPEKNKQSDVAFTTSLYVWDAPFCYGYYTGDRRSATTVIHEFGHYYDRWLYFDEDNVSNLDIAEVYSQGLELLMHPYFDQIMENPEEARKESLQDFHQAITYQALYEEFQQRLYAMDSFTSKEVGQLYVELLNDYGFGAYALPDEEGADYSWYSVSHIFSAPFYTISYTTSAMVALQIWAESQQNWRAGADTYLKLIHEDQNQPFSSLITGAGLKGVNDETIMHEIAGYFEEAFPASPSAGDFLPEDMFPDNATPDESLPETAMAA